MKYILLLLISSTLIFSCKSKQISDSNQQYSATHKIIIYKTVKDFSKFVPVIMNASKTEIISYPAPLDVVNNGKTTTPTILKNGYLLDNRGINEHVVFLKYTYESYSKLKEAPSLAELQKNILEKNPLIEIVYFKNSTNEKPSIKLLNKLIEKNFENCQRIQFTPLHNEL